jgi:hypothetical protein
MRTFRVVLHPPGLDDGLRLLQRREPVLIEALVPEEAVEALGEGVVVGLPGRENSNWTPFRYAQASSAFETN